MSDRVEAVVPIVSALSIAVLLGGPEAAVLATVGYLVGRFVGRTIAASGAVALLLVGALATLLEGDLVASLSYATDRAGAAQATTAGMAVLLGAVATDSRSRSDSSDGVSPEPLSVPSHAPHRFGVARFGSIAVAATVAFVGAILADLGQIPGTVSSAADELVSGARPVDVLAELSSQSAPEAASVGALMAAAYGPVGLTSMAALLLAAGSVAMISSRTLQGTAGWIAGAAVAVALVVASTVGGGVDDSMAVGLVAVAVAMHRTPGPSAAGGAGVVIGIATLCRPEALVVAAMLAVSALLRTPRRPIDAAATIVGAAVVAAPWLSWFDDHLVADLGSAIRVVSAVAVVVPVALSWALDRTVWRVP